MTTQPAKKLDATLHRERDGTFSMYFCRGPGKCTKTQLEKMRMSRLHKVCRDCIKGDDEQTLGEIDGKLARGDA